MTTEQSGNVNVQIGAGAASAQVTNGASVATVGRTTLSGNYSFTAQGAQTSYGTAVGMSAGGGQVGGTGSNSLGDTACPCTRRRCPHNRWIQS